MRVIRILLGASLLLGLTACGDEPRTVTDQSLTFGTLVEVSIYTDEPERAAQATATLRQHLERWHAKWHPWQGDGLARINERLAAGKPAAVDGQLARMLRQAERLYRTSDGRFDPAVGGLVRLWGFHSSDNAPEKPPSDAAIERWLAQRPTMSDIAITEDRIRTQNKALKLDLGGFAKGYAVDRAVELLRGQGVDNAIINTGGDLKAIGRHGERPWRVGIRDPRGKGILAAVTVHDGEAVFTSGDYERFFEWQGKRYHHILDPSTGRPARGLRSVTVIADDGATADAAATALFVAHEQWPEVARSMGLSQVMVVTDEDRVLLSEPMAERIRFVGEAPEQVRTVAWP